MAHPLHSPHSADAPNMALEDENNVGEYSAVSGLAVTGLILGILSVIALIHPLLWLLPLAAVVVNALALRQIALDSPRLIGRKAALLGLAAALIFGISAPARLLVHRRDLRAQSIEIAREWFTALRENRPEFAQRLSQGATTAAARARPPATDYKTNSMSAEALRNFVHDSPVELLLKLGKRARVRYYEDEAVWADKSMEGVRAIYVVTVGEGEQAISFFIRLGTTRSRDAATGEWQWQVSKHEFLRTPPPGLVIAAGG